MNNITLTKALFNFLIFYTFNFVYEVLKAKRYLLAFHYFKTKTEMHILSYYFINVLEINDYILYITFNVELNQI